MIRKIAGDEPIRRMLGNVVSELSGRASALNPQNQSVIVKS